MTKVAKDIKETVNGKLDVTVATHEHYDHLSGFNQAREVFDTIKMEQVWMAWTEDPTSELAKRLKGEREAALRATKLALSQLRIAKDSFGEDYIAKFENILNFFGPLNGVGRRTIKHALEYLKEKAGNSDNIKYLRPGQAPYNS